MLLLDMIYVKAMKQSTNREKKTDELASITDALDNMGLHSAILNTGSCYAPYIYKLFVIVTAYVAVFSILTLFGFKNKGIQSSPTRLALFILGCLSLLLNITIVVVAALGITKITYNKNEGMKCENIKKTMIFLIILLMVLSLIQVIFRSTLIILAID